MSESTPTFLLCPGQGAQHVGLGIAWADVSPAAKAVFDQADAALGFELSKLCAEGPEEKLNRTDYAQPAIYTASVACYEALVERGEIDPASVVATAGLSLGEFTALHLAGAFDFVDGLHLVRLRGQAMQEAATGTASSMVAVTGEVTEDQIAALCEKARGDGVLVPANFNSPMQVVVSGSTDACERAVGVADTMGFKPTPLVVAGAFHSPIMKPAAERLGEALEQLVWDTPRVPVVSNVTAQPHQADIASIKQHLIEQLTSPVRWSQSMAYAVAEHRGARFVELAPGKVLSGLMRRIDRKTKVQNFATPK